MENICIYAPGETDFTHNGMHILCPSSCSITEEKNGDYSLSLTHPKDSWGRWKLLKKDYIIKAQGQLFRIYSDGQSMSGDNDYSITVSAKHISYDLNAYLIQESHPTLLTPEQALEWITTPSHNGYTNILNGNPRERFKFYTDLDSTVTPEYMENLKTAYYEKMSVTKALIGESNCFLNTWGGVIYRDNFNFGILERRGADDAFNVTYGSNMKKITVNTNSGNSYCDLYYEGTIYSEEVTDSEKERREVVITGIVTNDEIKTDLPVRPMGVYKFEVNIKSIKKAANETLPTIYEMRAECERIAAEYLKTECLPQINYTVEYADLRKQDIYKEFVDMQTCNIGDTGTIYHDELDIATVQEIIKKTIDGITGETLSIELGTQKKTLTGQLAKGGT